MLIRFAVENFLSFKEKQVFSMVAAKHTRHPDHVADISGKRILKGSFLFGANASGKSNFIKAISSARTMIFRGVSGVERKYFRLDPAWADKPGSFQFDIFSNGHFYSYGFAFSYSDEHIIAEWLYKIQGNSETCVFEREYKDGKTSINTDLRLSEDNKYRFRIYGEDLNKAKSFLLEMAEKEAVNNPEFQDFKNVWKWFWELVVIFPNTHLGLDAYRSLASDKHFHSLLQSLDTGIKSVSIEEQPMDKILPYFHEQIREDFLTERMENIGDVSEDMQSYDGLKNTSAYKIDAEKDSLAVPAVDLALNYEAGSITGWYIGSVAQHTELFRNKDIVYDTFEKINGEIMKGYYWTSTEVESSPNYYSYSFSYEGDSEKSLPALKNKKYKVRPFVTISRKK